MLQDLEIEIDVVFSDVEMPGSMDGLALANWPACRKEAAIGEWC